MIYSAIASLDGYLDDPAGDSAWSAPDDEALAHITEGERPLSTYLYGRRMYETMRIWQTWPDEDTGSPLDLEWARMWRAAEKIVYSRTLTDATSPATRIEREFDPAVVRRLVEESPTDMSIGGAVLAGQALAAGIIDELRWYSYPVAVGGGNPWLPRDVRLDLELIETRGFASGVVFSRYRVASTRNRRE
ncbi:dihydrofolate reductase family protein [Gryllotalpicola daejeonensis]|uniref:Dihydrofolate reductase family protein n=1 Tax=Gryllotalpicola daejeonensis TaxID=993087 RepID=A0ABP7ZK90_9MICO